MHTKYFKIIFSISNSKLLDVFTVEVKNTSCMDIFEIHFVLRECQWKIHLSLFLNHVEKKEKILSFDWHPKLKDNFEC